MKKLNKRGFTLIELLAVIVILAIIVVVTVPTILNSINDARLSSLHSLSKEVANWYDTSSAQDKIALTGNKILNGATATEEWQCLGAVLTTDKTRSLADLYGLSEDDLILTGNAPIPIDETNVIFVESFDEPTEIGKFVIDSADFNTLCSAIKIVNNRAWVVLISTDNGKFNTNGDYRTYAASFAPNAYDYGV